MSVTFKGVYEMSLGGFPCIRGYASLRDIARCSYPDPAYQRELKEEHVEQIKQFFEAGDYLFSPEIILSATLEADFEKDDAPRDDPLQTVMRGAAFKSNVNGLQIRPRTSRYDLIIPDDEKLLKRIDGNHRLNALEALDDEAYDRFLAPFCIILFDKADAARNEKALFHNINSKSRPLTSEESLRGIIDDEAGFPDDALKAQFGGNYLMCRNMLKKLNFDYLPNLETVFGQADGQTDCSRTVVLKSLENVRELLERKEKVKRPNQGKVLKGIQAVN